MKITSHQIQNKRYYQEDRFFITEPTKNGTLLGVFDGHGGEFTAEYAMKYAPIIWKALLRINYPKNQILNKIIDQLHRKTEDHSCGSTASLVWISPDNKSAQIVILGDSPVIIKSTDKIWISPEHNVRTNKAEEAAAIGRDGFIRDGYLFDSNTPWNGGLQMSRTLGDRDFHRVLSRIPEYFNIPLNEESWIICGSDGILDPSHNNKDACTTAIILTANGIKATANDIINTAINNDSDDNATAILIKL